MTGADIRIQIPEWQQRLAAEKHESFASDEARMRFVIELSRRNIETGSGGPFAAAVFDCEQHELISVGTNLVTASNCSIAHAEMVAISMAQQRLGTYDLGGPGLPRFELVSSCEPCAMCFGALPWSGIRRLVCGARDEDARAIGFDEGPKMRGWKEELERRGIDVSIDVCRTEASHVLQTYASAGGEIYNARRG